MVSKKSSISSKGSSKEYDGKDNNGGGKSDRTGSADLDNYQLGVADLGLKFNAYTIVRISRLSLFNWHALDERRALARHCGKLLLVVLLFHCQRRPGSQDGTQKVKLTHDLTGFHRSRFKAANTLRDSLAVAIAHLRHTGMR